MLRTYVFNIWGLVVLAVVVHFGYSQELKQTEDCSRFNDYHCVNFANCPSGADLVRKQIATTCGFENATSIKICCPRSYSPSSTPIITTRSISTTTVRLPIKSPSVITRPTSTVSSKRPPSNSVTTGPPSKNATAIAIMNCQKYEKYQYVTKYLEVLIPGGETVTFTELDCVTLIEHWAGPAVDPKEVPHMALIGYGDNLRNVSWACSGSLISEKFILSAAYCETTDLGEAKWVLLGDLYINSMPKASRKRVRSKIYKVVRRFSHPNYKPSFIYNDIALFELNTTVEMSPFVRPACLYTSTHNEEAYSITGWGLTGPAERRSDRLLRDRVKIQEENLCVAEYSNSSELDHGYEPSSMICAGNLDLEHDRCTGDSGGPLQYKVSNTPCMWVVAGITSFGRGFCGDTLKPGIYTKVAHYLDWIQSIVWP